eukprot:TRINITY_DN4709_c0_g1_i1.p3 TRINITY_DN4709_c0_g1~~TRINITY_DN4709_c0_g1_i1.p3  ORF type:complete len:75 (-),score=18.33 TRINITY_DN4709_c0_g1_i1:2-226(-)
MDPMARHAMSIVISHSLQRRSVILTTHLMEECELMATRIGIMINGQLACLGTLQRLKSTVAAGRSSETAKAHRG